MLTNQQISELATDDRIVGPIRRNAILAGLDPDAVVSDWHYRLVSQQHNYDPARAAPNTWATGQGIWAVQSARSARGRSRGKEDKYGLRVVDVDADPDLPGLESLPAPPDDTVASQELAEHIAAALRLLAEVSTYSHWLLVNYYAGYTWEQIRAADPQRLSRAGFNLRLADARRHFKAALLRVQGDY